MDEGKRTAASTASLEKAVKALSHKMDEMAAPYYDEEKELIVVPATSAVRYDEERELVVMTK